LLHKLAMMMMPSMMRGMFLMLITTHLVTDGTNAYADDTNFI